MEGITPHEILLNMFTHFPTTSSRTSAIESDLHIFAVIEHFYIKDKRGGLWFYQIVLILLHRFNGELK